MVSERVIGVCGNDWGRLFSRDGTYVKVHGFDIIRFNDKNNFKVWQTDCRDILVNLDETETDALNESKNPLQKLMIYDTEK